MARVLSKCFFVLLMLLSLNGLAQTPDRYVLYTGGNNVIPFNFSSNKAQWLYYPSEFTGGTMQAGNITTIYIRAASAVTNATLPNLTIKLGTTTLNALTNGPWVAGLTTVLSVPTYTQTATINQWVPYTLTTPFFYDGVSNLILEVSVSATNAGGYTVYQGSLANNRRMYGLAANAASTGADGTQVSMGFDIVSQCSGAPAVGDVTSALDTIDCGSTTTMTYNVGPTLPGVISEWQESSNLSSWTDLGITANTYTPLTINRKMYYRMKVTCTYSNAVSYSSAKSVDVRNLPLTWNPDTLICDGDVMTISGGLAGVSYYWNTGDTTQAINITGPGRYTTYVTSANGCVSSGTKTVSPVLVPVGNFSVTRVSFMEYEAVAYVNNAAVIEWDFGDGGPLKYGNPVSNVYANHGVYIITMKAKDICGNYDLTAKAIELAGGSGGGTNVEELIAEVGLSIYPNPANNEITIQNEHLLPISEVLVYDIAGKLLLQQPVGNSHKEVKLNIQALSSGKYILNIKTKDKTIPTHFIKN